MRRKLSTERPDLRTINGKPLRKSEVLPLRKDSDDNEDLYFHEAQTSSLSWGPDEWFWTELFLVDTYFGSEPRMRTYFVPPAPGHDEGNSSDPPLGGGNSMKFSPHFDPREYFLHKLDCRLGQVATEYGALVETFNQRMENYVSCATDLMEARANIPES
jgi:hypothetical protein